MYPREQVSEFQQGEMAPTFPEAGELFADRYRMEAIIAEGGFGRVYRATQVDLHRSVAIKILRPDPKGGDGNTKTGPALQAVIKRFEREARLVSKLRDTHTVTVHDFGSTDDNLLYMVMEYVDGLTVGQLVDDVGKIPAARAVRIIEQSLSSLHEAHQLGVLHRDIKPHNIMLFDHLGRKDQVKVLDFGLVKSMSGPESGSTSQVDLTSEGALLGTPRYMSPEQIRGDEMGPPSDIYSLGLVFYEMLSGTKAVDADSTMNIIARHLDPRPFEPPPDLDLPAGLRHVLARMLEKEPAHRYQSVDEVIAGLEDWSSDDVVPKIAPSGGVVLERATESTPSSADDTRRLVVLTAGGLGAMALVATVIAIIAVGSSSRESARQPAEVEVDPPVTAQPAAAVEPTRDEEDHDGFAFEAVEAADAGGFDTDGGVGPDSPAPDLPDVGSSAGPTEIVEPSSGIPEEQKRARPVKEQKRTRPVEASPRPAAASDDSPSRPRFKILE